MVQYRKKAKKIIKFWSCVSFPSDSDRTISAGYLNSFLKKIIFKTKMCTLVSSFMKPFYDKQFGGQNLTQIARSIVQDVLNQQFITSHEMANQDDSGLNSMRHKYYLLNVARLATARSNALMVFMSSEVFQPVLHAKYNSASTEVLLTTRYFKMVFGITLMNFCTKMHHLNTIPKKMFFGTINHEVFFSESPSYSLVHTNIFI